MDKNMLNDVKNINAPRHTKNDSKHDINEGTEISNEILNKPNDSDLILKKKSNQKDDRKSFLIYMDAKELKELSLIHI